MKGRPDITVVDVDAGVVSVCVCRVAGGRVEVLRGGVFEPAEGESPEACVERALGAAGAGGRVIVSIPRREVVLKRVELPGGDLSASERFDAVRLRVDDAAGDEPLAAAWAHADDGTSAVLAMMPAARLRERVALIGRGGGVARQAVVRTCGAAALVAGDGPTLVIALGARSTEIAVVSRGVPAVARAIDAGASIGQDAREQTDGLAARVAVEAKRTAMSARTIGGEPTSVVVLGEDAYADSVRSACELELGLPAGEGVGVVAWADDIKIEDRRALTALAGVALAAAGDSRIVDLLNPERAPDTRARGRQLALAAVLALVTIVGGGVVAGRASLASMRAELDRADDAYADAYAQLVRYRARDARVSHAEAWADADVDWVERFARVVEKLPARSEGALAEISGRADHAIAFEPGQNVYPGAWSWASRATVRVEGAARDRNVMLDVRRAFVDDPAFRVETRGPDADATFELTLTMDARSGGGQR